MDAFWMVLAAVVIVTLFVARAVSVLVQWRVDATSPRGVSRRLVGGDHRHAVRFDANRYAWNPALPVGVDNRVTGPGLARYELDAQGVVHLEFRSDRGEVLSAAGPLPVLGKPLDPTPSVASLVAAPTLAVIGGLIGYAGSSGSVEHDLAVGLWSGIAGWVVGSVIQMTVGMVARTRAFAAQTR